MMRFRRSPLALLTLEDRLAPATFTVTTLADNGSNATPIAGSLRAAIINANNTPGADTIAFALPGSGAQTISLAAPLPDITESVVIDGTTQAGFGGSPLVALSGTNAGAGAFGLNFVNHTLSTVKSLAIGGFSGAGIRISGGGSHTILGSRIGTNAAGTAALANAVGIQLVNGTLGNRIGGNAANELNVISGNTGPGIRIDASPGNLVAGNFIGTEATGNSPLANAGGGIAMLNGASGNTIGGVSPGMGNVISGNGTAGVNVTGAATSANIIVGNRIGLGFAGFALPNSGPGVRFASAAGSAPAGGIASGTENIVRNNTIAKNSAAGIAVLDTSRQVRIEGNSIRENGGLGIQVDATANAGLQSPLIASIKAATGGQMISGTFNGQPNAKYAVSLFSSSAADPSGFGEGQNQIGTLFATTNATGGGSFEFLLLSGVGGAFITATVTHDALGDTSAFSNAFARPDVLLTSTMFAVGSGATGSPTVVLTDSIGTVIRSSEVFAPSMTGGVRVATGDLTNDNIPDLAVGTGVGFKAEVRVIDGATQQTLFQLFPFGDFNRGVFVALGDVNNDGYADLIITPDEGGGPRVRIFDGKTFSQIADFFAIDDANFRGGARPAVGDLNGDGFGDLVVSAGFGGGPRIAAFSGKTLGPNGGPKLFGDFFAFEPVLRNGAFVSVADINKDGFAELIVAAGPGGGPRVRVLDGKTLVQSQGQTLKALADFFAGDPNSRAGVRVFARDFDDDGRAELVTASASGSLITVSRGTDIAVGNTLNTTFFELFSPRTGGIFVG